MGLDELKRTPLLTPYLKKDNEPVYHMCDEPFDYSQVDGAKKMQPPSRAEATVLYQQLISPQNAKVSLEYHIPISGFVKLEILDKSGTSVAVPVDGYRVAGVHMANWDSSKHATGTYSYKLRINGADSSGQIHLMK